MQQVLDLFAGPGGWDEGVRPLGMRPHGVELDWLACATGKAAGHRRTRADIARLEPTAFGRTWGLLASPPCQGFSMAGHGRGRMDSVHLLESLARVRTRTDLEDAIAKLHANMTDDRTVLVLEPLRWALTLQPSWMAWEQVPTVLPVWEACADVLRRIGYSVTTGNLHAEQYGVPQTRKRAVLVARAPWLAASLGPARLPVPTHSRYHTRAPERLDPGVLPWVTMAEALGWGMTERPSMTVTGGGARTGGAEPFGNAARQGMRREAEAGRWLRMGTHVGATVRSADQPAHAITGRGTATWLRSNYSGHGGGQTASERGRTVRGMDQPASAITGRPLAWVEGTREQAQRQGRDGGATQQRISVQEAALLQTFPPDYPWQGNQGQQFEQVGNAVPPLLARRIVQAATGEDA